MKRPVFIAADIGAGSGRIFSSGFDGKKIDPGEVYRFENGPVYADGTLYWDILNIIKQVGTGIKKAIAGTDGRVASVGIDSWGADLGLLDSRGELLLNPVSYRDKSILTAEKEIEEIVSRDELNRLNSSLTYNHSTLYQLFYIYRHKKHVADLIYKYLPIAPLIGYFLTGEMVVDTSMFSGSQFFDVGKKIFKKDLLDRLGINREIIPPRTEAGTVMGRIDKAYAESGQDTKVSLVCGHDTASAVTGMPLKKGSCFINSGTWSVMGIETKNVVTDTEVYKNNFTNWNTYRDRVIFLKIFNGFYFMQECKREWDRQDGSYNDYSELYGKISVDDKAVSLIDLEERSLLMPGGPMTDKVEAFFKNSGQACSLSRDQMITAILQSIILEYSLVFERLESLYRKKIEDVHMFGGGSLNRVFCQWTADCLGLDVHTCYPEAAVSGNIIVQLIALGEIRGIGEGREIIKASFPGKVYHPSQKRYGWDELVNKYQGLKQIITKERK
jgi:rhamnulokinase